MKVKANIIRHIIAVLVLICIFFSCKEDDDNTIDPSFSVNRTILVYMMAQNDLNEFVQTNIEKMKSAVSNKGTNGGNLVIYLDQNSSPQLIKLKRTPSGIVTESVIKTYPDQNSSSPEVLNTVINDTRQRFPADEYGLILWSHSSGWIPKTRQQRSFGSDGGYQMDIDELGGAIPDNLFRFIICDACYMGSVEIAYELRRKTQFLIASATEVMGEGFPYDKITPFLFSRTTDMEGICRTFFEKYASNNISPYASIGLIKTAELDSVMRIVKKIVTDNPKNFSDSQIQQFGRSSMGYGYKFFDMEEYFCQAASSESYAQELREQIGKSVLYKAYTPYFFNLALKKYCGLSCYSILSDYGLYIQFYQKLAWYKDIFN